jgi:hypothetical protein
MKPVEIQFVQGQPATPVPPALVGLSADDTIEVVAFDRHSEGDKPERPRVTLRVIRAATPK